MSVYRPKGSPYFHFDFQWRGDRFYGSTKRTNRREAEAVERAERERAKLEAGADFRPVTSGRLTNACQFDMLLSGPGS
jgi:hypothetical protein